MSSDEAGRRAGSPGSRWRSGVFGEDRLGLGARRHDQTMNLVVFGVRVAAGRDSDFVLYGRSPGASASTRFAMMSAPSWAAGHEHDRELTCGNGSGGGCELDVKLGESAQEE